MISNNGSALSRFCPSISGTRRSYTTHVILLVVCDFLRKDPVWSLPLRYPCAIAGRPSLNAQSGDGDHGRCARARTSSTQSSEIARKSRCEARGRMLQRLPRQLPTTRSNRTQCRGRREASHVSARACARNIVLIVTNSRPCFIEALLAIRRVYICWHWSPLHAQRKCPHCLSSIWSSLRVCVRYEGLSISCLFQSHAFRPKIESGDEVIGCAKAQTARARLS
jgi:hypothetical protein